MSGYKTELLGNVEEVVPHVKWTHYCIHGEAFVAKRLSGYMKTTLEEVVKIINLNQEHYNPGFWKSFAKTWEVTTYSFFWVLKSDEFPEAKFFFTFFWAKRQSSSISS